MVLNKKYIAIILLLLVIVVCFTLSHKLDILHRKKMETFTSSASTSYAFTLLQTLGPIIYDKTEPSTDKINSIQTLKPQISDSTIVQILNNTAQGPDAQILDIQNYLASCPTNPIDLGLANILNT